MKNASKNKRLTLKKSAVIPTTLFMLTLTTTAIAAVITHQAAKAPSNVPSDNPVTVNSFSLNGAEATNKDDKLVWSRCLVGQTFSNDTCTGEPTEFDSWEAALNAVSAAQATEGWRVPNIKELMHITDNTKAFPATNPDVFAFTGNLKFAEDDGYGGGLRNPSTPFIWSSTPVTRILIKVDENYVALTRDEALEKTAAARQEIEKTYALDLSYGNAAKIYRDGNSVGNKQTTQYYKPDPDNVKKARYVLLVKDS